MGGLWSTCTHIYSILLQFWPPAPKWTVDEIPDLTGQVFVVTGASGGIGRSCATTLVQKGGKVYVACRSETSCRKVAREIKTTTGAEVHSLVLDLSSLAGIERAAQSFLSQETHLNALFNNGGVWAPTTHTTEDGLDMTFGTNVVGAFYLTHLLMPALLTAAQSSPDGTARVVGTSSSTAEMAVLDYASLLGPVANTKPVAAGVLYAQSKLGVAISARELARRYGEQGIVSMSAHPGSISTGLFRNLPFPVRPLMQLLTFAPEKGALPLLYCGVGEEAKDFNGRYIIPWDRLGAAWQPQPSVNDPAVGKKLWEWMDDIVSGRPAYLQAQKAIDRLLIRTAGL